MDNVSYMCSDPLSVSDPLDGSVCKLLLFACNLNSYRLSVMHNTKQFENLIVFKRLTFIAPTGLRLVLYLEDHEVIEGLTQGRGARVDIHPFNTMTFPVETGMSVAPGFETYLGIRMVRYLVSERDIRLPTLKLCKF